MKWRADGGAPVSSRLLFLSLGQRGSTPTGGADQTMSDHQHNFINEYDGLVAFGFSREVDEKSLMVYLQKFSDDALMKALVPRLSDQEIAQLFDFMSRLMHQHFNDEEYHQYFLKDEEHSHEHHEE